MSKIKPIVRGNIVVWPLIPRLTASVKLRNRTGDPERDNVVTLPVVKLDPPPSYAGYNDIQKIIERTMRSQRYTKTSRYALEKLRKMRLNPA